MHVRITSSRHSAFYSPLISAMAAGFLEKHGLTFSYGVLAPGETAAGLIRKGLVDVMQSAPSTNWAKMDKGETGFPMHFALINQRDGFFLVGRAGGLDKDAWWSWKNLEGKTLIADHGSQPLTMLKYAVHNAGADWDKIHVVNAGTSEEMFAAFRAGQGDFVHLQAPAPQLLMAEGAGYTVASVGASMPANAFSTLCAGREFMETEAFRAFVAAFAEAKAWVRATSPTEIAAIQASHFPAVSKTALSLAIAEYQTIGAWDGGVEIPRHLYEQSLDVFEYSGAIRIRQPYDSVCVAVSV